MKIGARTQAVRYLFVVAAIAVITAVDFKLRLNHTTVALMFLVTVLLTSAYWGLRYAVVMAVGATAAFNFFFLPPVGTFTIADPQNWVALFAFLVTALVASNLAERARSEAEGAQQRRREVERFDPRDNSGRCRRLTAANRSPDRVSLRRVRRPTWRASLSIGPAPSRRSTPRRLLAMGRTDKCCTPRSRNCAAA